MIHGNEALRGEADQKDRKDREKNSSCPALKKRIRAANQKESRKNHMLKIAKHAD